MALGNSGQGLLLLPVVEPHCVASKTHPFPPQAPPPHHNSAAAFASLSPLLWLLWEHPAGDAHSLSLCLVLTPLSLCLGLLKLL